MKDEIITCIQCERTFVFPATEKNRFLESGFDMPKRCPECRRNRARVTGGQQERRQKDKKRHRRHWEDLSMDE